MMYKSPKSSGTNLSKPAIKDWKGSTPSAAILKTPTLIAQIITPKSDIKIRFTKFLFILISYLLKHRVQKLGVLNRKFLAY